MVSSTEVSQLIGERLLGAARGSRGNHFWRQNLYLPTAASQPNDKYDTPPDVDDHERSDASTTSDNM